MTAHSIFVPYVIGGAAGLIGFLKLGAHLENWWNGKRTR